jgi:hypothetical protein
MQKIMEKKISHLDGPDAEKFGRKEAKYHPFCDGEKKQNGEGLESLHPTFLDSICSPARQGSNE